MEISQKIKKNILQVHKLELSPERMKLQVAFQNLQVKLKTSQIENVIPEEQISFHKRLFVKLRHTFKSPALLTGLKMNLSLALYLYMIYNIFGGNKNDLWN